MKARAKIAAGGTDRRCWADGASAPSRDTRRLRRWALELADWSPVRRRSGLTVFDHHLSEEEAADLLRPFDVVCTLRERMAFPRTLIERLPNLKLITIVGRSLPNLDMGAATDHGVLVTHSDFASPRFRSVRDATPELAWGLMIARCATLPRSIGACVTGVADDHGRALSGKRSDRWGSTASANPCPDTS